MFRFCHSMCNSFSSSRNPTFPSKKLFFYIKCNCRSLRNIRVWKHNLPVFIIMHRLGWKHIWRSCFISITVNLWRLLFLPTWHQSFHFFVCFCSHVRHYSFVFFPSTAAVISTCIHTQTHTNPVHMCVNELISLRFPPLVYIFSLLASRSCRSIFVSWSI